MNKRIRHNVSNFLKMEKQAQAQAPQYVAQPQQQDQGGSWLGTLGKLGLLGGLGYGAYKFGPQILKSLQGKGNDQGSSTRRAAVEGMEGARLMDTADDAAPWGLGWLTGSDEGGFNDLRERLHGPAEKVMEDILARGGDVQDFVNQMRQMGYTTFGRPENKSILPWSRGLQEDDIADIMSEEYAGKAGPLAEAILKKQRRGNM